MKRGLSLLLLVVLAAAATWYSLSPQFPVAQGLDLKGGMRVTLEPDDTKEAGQNVDLATLGKVREVLENRVNTFGLSGTEVRIKGNNQILITLPGAQNPEEALQTISKVAQLEFRHLKNVVSTRNPNGRYVMSETPGNPETGEPNKFTFTDQSTGQTVPVEQVLAESEKILTGSHLLPESEPGVNTGSGAGSMYVSFKLNPEGARVFADFTRENVDEYLAIVLDNQIISAPTINTPITGGEGQITGNFTIAEARELANLLNSGALPVPMRPAETQYVGATLGQESIHQSIVAGVAGLALVLVFMLAYYWLPGFIACIALLFYAALTFSIFKGIPGFLNPIVLDLPGITGFILSVGMAVDANILIFERMKEELRAGQPLNTAIQRGFQRAFSSILDSNVTTWIICGIMIWLGAPIIKGFAITLAIGVAVSMFTAITFTRTLLLAMVSMDWARNVNLYALNVSWLRLFFPSARRGGILRVFEKRKAYLGVSVLVVALSLGAIALTPFGYGLRPGIDFTGGSVVEVPFREPVTREQVLAALPEGLNPTLSIARSEQPWYSVTVEATEVDAASQRTIRERLANGNVLRGFDPDSYQAETKTAEAAKPAENAAKPAEGEQAKPATPAGPVFQATATYTSPVTEADVRRALNTKINPSDADLNLKNLKIAVQEIPHQGDQAISVALIQARQLKPEELQEIKANLSNIGGGIVTPMYSESSIGPSVAKEVTLNAFWSMFVGSIFIVLYLAWSFRIGGNFRTGFRFGAGAVIALLHDVIITLGLFAVMGALMNWQVDSLFVTACLTILGFSVHDTIVVYDRLRENVNHRRRGETLVDLSNRAITETFDRSLNTTLTVLLVIATLVLFGGESIKLFNVALLVGVAVGTYSSIFVAAPLVVLMDRGETLEGTRVTTTAPRPATLAGPAATSLRRPTAAPAPATRRPAPTATPKVETSSATAADAEATEDGKRSGAASKPGTIRPKRKRRL